MQTASSAAAAGPKRSTGAAAPPSTRPYTRIPSNAGPAPVAASNPTPGQRDIRAPSITSETSTEKSKMPSTIKRLPISQAAAAAKASQRRGGAALTSPRGRRGIVSPKPEDIAKDNANSAKREVSPGGDASVPSDSIMSRNAESTRKKSATRIIKSRMPDDRASTSTTQRKGDRTDDSAAQPNVSGTEGGAPAGQRSRHASRKCSRVRSISAVKRCSPNARRPRVQSAGPSARPLLPPNAVTATTDTLLSVTRPRRERPPVESTPPAPSRLNRNNTATKTATPVPAAKSAFRRIQSSAPLGTAANPADTIQVHEGARDDSNLPVLQNLNNSRTAAALARPQSVMLKRLQLGKGDAEVCGVRSPRQLLPVQQQQKDETEISKPKRETKPTTTVAGTGGAGTETADQLERALAYLEVLATVVAHKTIVVPAAPDTIPSLRKLRMDTQTAMLHLSELERARMETQDTTRKSLNGFQTAAANLQSGVDAVHQYWQSHSDKLVQDIYRLCGEKVVKRLKEEVNAASQQAAQIVLIRQVLLEADEERARALYERHCSNISIEQQQNSNFFSWLKTLLPPKPVTATHGTNKSAHANEKGTKFSRQLSSTGTVGAKSRRASFANAAPQPPTPAQTPNPSAIKGQQQQQQESHNKSTLQEYLDETVDKHVANVSTSLSNRKAALETIRRALEGVKEQRGTGARMTASPAVPMGELEEAVRVMENQEAPALELSRMEKRQLESAVQVLLVMRRVRVAEHALQRALHFATVLSKKDASPTAAASSIGAFEAALLRSGAAPLTTAAVSLLRAVHNANTLLLSADISNSKGSGNVSSTSDQLANDENTRTLHRIASLAGVTSSLDIITNPTAECDLSSEVAMGFLQSHATRTEVDTAVRKLMFPLEMSRLCLSAAVSNANPAFWPSGSTVASLYARAGDTLLNLSALEHTRTELECVLLGFGKASPRSGVGAGSVGTLGSTCGVSYLGAGAVDDGATSMGSRAPSSLWNGGETALAHADVDSSCASTTCSAARLTGRTDGASSEAASTQYNMLRDVLSRAQAAGISGDAVRRAEQLLDQADTLKVKVHFRSQIRLVPLHRARDVAFDELHSKLRRLCLEQLREEHNGKGTEYQRLRITYQDSDGDHICIMSTEEWQLFLAERADASGRGAKVDLFCEFPQAAASMRRDSRSPSQTTNDLMKPKPRRGSLQAPTGTSTRAASASGALRSHALGSSPVMKPKGKAGDGGKALRRTSVSQERPRADRRHTSPSPETPVKPKNIISKTPTKPQISVDRQRTAGNTSQVPVQPAPVSLPLCPTGARSPSPGQRSNNGSKKLSRKLSDSGAGSARWWSHSMSISPPTSSYSADTDIADMEGSTAHSTRRSSLNSFAKKSAVTATQDPRSPSSSQLEEEEDLFPDPVGKVVSITTSLQANTLPSNKAPESNRPPIPPLAALGTVAANAAAVEEQQPCTPQESPECETSRSKVVRIPAEKDARWSKTWEMDDEMEFQAIPSVESSMTNRDSTLTRSSAPRASVTPASPSGNRRSEVPLASVVGDERPGFLQPATRRSFTVTSTRTGQHVEEQSVSSRAGATTAASTQSGVDDESISPRTLTSVSLRDLPNKYWTPRDDMDEFELQSFRSEDTCITVKRRAAAAASKPEGNGTSLSREEPNRSEASVASVVRRWDDGSAEAKVSSAQPPTAPAAKTPMISKPPIYTSPNMSAILNQETASENAKTPRQLASSGNSPVKNEKKTTECNVDVEPKHPSVSPAASTSSSESRASPLNNNDLQKHFQQLQMHYAQTAGNLRPRRRDADETGSVGTDSSTSTSQNNSTTRQPRSASTHSVDSTRQFLTKKVPLLAPVDRESSTGSYVSLADKDESGECARKR